jgi:hypothetical protein
MAKIFRDRVPDDFMQSWLQARKHPTWELAYEAAVAALKDPQWHTCYSKHVIEKITKIAKPDSAKAKPAAQAQGKQAAPQAVPQEKDDKQQKLDFPVSKNGNVNPNFKSDCRKTSTTTQRSWYATDVEPSTNGWQHYVPLIVIKRGARKSSR